MRFQVDIPGVGQIEVDGNFATDDSIQELLSLMKGQKTSSNSPMKDFDKNVKKASDGLNSFSTELEDVEIAQKNLTTRMSGLANGLESGVNSMKQFTDSGGNMTDVMNSMAPVLEGTARGIGGLVPILGEGLEELAGAAATAAFGLATAAVGMIEGFIGLNKQLYNFNLMGAGGFEAFADAADTAQLPINEFANAVMNSSEKLRLFGSGAPGGIGQISQALGVLQRGQLLEQLYSLGFTTEEVVAGMADYAIGAERQGKALNAAELATGSFAYLKNLRELARLTGVSVKEQQAEIDAQRANLFIQNQMIDLAPETRAQAMAFAAAIPEALTPIKDFIVSGQSYNTESALMVSQMPTVATALRNAYTSVENGSKTADEAQVELKNTLQANRALIDAELKQVTATFGTAPDSIIQEGDALGKALVSVTGLMNAAEVEVPSKIAGGENSEINKALGKMEETINKVQTEVQQSLLTMTKGLQPTLNKFADGVDTIVTAIGDGRNALEEYFGEFKTKDKPVKAMFNDLFISLENSIANAITIGFNNVMASTKIGSMMGFKSQEEQIQNLKELYSYLEDPDKMKEFVGDNNVDVATAQKLIQNQIALIEDLGYKLPTKTTSSTANTGTEVLEEILSEPPPDLSEIKSNSEKVIETLAEVTDNIQTTASDVFLPEFNSGLPTNDFSPLSIPVSPVTALPDAQNLDISTPPVETPKVINDGEKLQEYKQRLSETYPQALDPNYRVGTVGFGWNDLTQADLIRRQEGIDRREQEVRELENKLKDKYGNLGDLNGVNELVQQNRTMLSYMENTSNKLNEMSSAMQMANVINRSGKMLGA